VISLGKVIYLNKKLKGKVKVIKPVPLLKFDLSCGKKFVRFKTISDIKGGYY